MQRFGSALNLSDSNSNSDSVSQIAIDLEQVEVDKKSVRQFGSARTFGMSFNVSRRVIVAGGTVVFLVLMLVLLLPSSSTPTLVSIEISFQIMSLATTIFSDVACCAMSCFITFWTFFRFPFTI